jgi:hypothetical protein
MRFSLVYGLYDMSSRLTQSLLLDPIVAMSLLVCGHNCDSIRATEPPAFEFGIDGRRRMRAHVGKFSVRLCRRSENLLKRLAWSIRERHPREPDIH